MPKSNYSTIIDFGSSKLRLGVFDNKLSKLFFQSKKIQNKNNYEEYLKSIKLLIREAENKISTHLENIIVLYDSSELLTVELSIKKKVEQNISFREACSLMILEANQIIKDSYVDKKIIHVIVNKYIINEKEFLNIPDEIPKFNTLILEIKFISLPSKEHQNIIEIFKKNNLKILNFFSTSLVKSFKYIDFFKENKLVVFLDIGLDRTTIIFFKNKKLYHLNTITIGGNNISKDISQILKLSIDESEKLKKTFNKSETDFSFSGTDPTENFDTIKKIIGKNISIDLLKKVVLTRIEEIIELSFKSINISNSFDKKQDLKLVLIGNGSKIFNRNSFHIEDKYNFKEINFYEESDYEICEAGLIYKEKFKDENPQNFKKNQKKIGFFQRFFNIFGND